MKNMGHFCIIPTWAGPGATLGEETSVMTQTIIANGEEALKTNGDDGEEMVKKLLESRASDLFHCYLLQYYCS
jgi:hypothetical protein